jgi:hypothetical protein
MSTFSSTIQLHDADENDYIQLLIELELQAQKKQQQTFLDKDDKNGNKKITWVGNVGIQKIGTTISSAAQKVGKKYSFSIMKNK